MIASSRQVALPAAVACSEDISDHHKSKNLTDRKLNIKLLIIFFTLSYYCKVNMVMVLQK